MPDVKAKLLLQGAVAVGNTPAQLDAVVKAELRQWDKLVKERNIRAD